MEEIDGTTLTEYTCHQKMIHSHCCVDTNDKNKTVTENGIDEGNGIFFGEDE